LKRFYGRLYFRPSKNDSLAIEVITQADMMKGRLREGVEFIHDGGGGALLAWETPVGGNDREWLSRKSHRHDHTLGADLLGFAGQFGCDVVNGEADNILSTGPEMCRSRFKAHQHRSAVLWPLRKMNVGVAVPQGLQHEPIVGHRSHALEDDMVTFSSVGEGHHHRLGVVCLEHSGQCALALQDEPYDIAVVLEACPHRAGNERTRQAFAHPVGQLPRRKMGHHRIGIGCQNIAR
jgi:hypothetical protein